jgi:glutamyl-Q tRNA(Asp) synthetase
VIVPYRGRFAPTPSGPLHFGSLIAALGSWLDARSHGGEWLLRIDDLDRPRVVPGAADLILRCLAGLGLEWDGEVIFQSRRHTSYHTALQHLRQQGLVYACACSRREIAARARTGSEGPIYPGTCRNGLVPERDARALRVNTQRARVQFEDGVLSVQSRDLEESSGDFVLLPIAPQPPVADVYRSISTISGSRG